jgi:hypothetical protein
MSLISVASDGMLVTWDHLIVCSQKEEQCYGLKRHSFKKTGQRIMSEAVITDL